LIDQASQLGNTDGPDRDGRGEKDRYKDSDLTDSLRFFIGWSPTSMVRVRSVRNDVSLHLGFYGPDEFRRVDDVHQFALQLADARRNGRCPVAGGDVRPGGPAAGLFDFLRAHANDVAAVFDQDSQVSRPGAASGR